MPVDFREEARQREVAKLRRAGLNPDGSPLKKPKPGANADDDEGGEDDDRGDEDETDEEREERERREAEEGGGDDDDGDDGGDDAKNEIEELRRQLAALSGRVGPAQSSAAEYERLYTGERREREREARELNDRIAVLTKQIEERDEKFEPKDLLSEDEIADIDPKVIDVVMKLATGIAKKMTPKVNARAEALSVLAERDAQRVVDHRTEVLTDPARGLHQLGTLAYDPKFIAWSQEEDNDIDSVIHSLLNAKSTGEVDRYARIVAKRIARFKDAAKGSPRSTDANRSLSKHMDRRPKKRLSQEEVDAKFRRAKSLSRSSNSKDREEAKKILDSLK